MNAIEDGIFLAKAMSYGHSVLLSESIYWKPIS